MLTLSLEAATVSPEHRWRGSFWPATVLNWKSRTHPLNATNIHTVHFVFQIIWQPNQNKGCMLTLKIFCCVSSIQASSFSASSWASILIFLCLPVFLTSLLPDFLSSWFSDFLTSSSSRDALGPLPHPSLYAPLPPYSFLLLACDCMDRVT